MGKDKCVICGSLADRMLPVAGFVEFNCLECRSYSISEDVLRSVAEDGRSFYVARTQALLEAERKGRPTPVITRLEVTVHELLSPIVNFD